MRKGGVVMSANQEKKEKKDELLAEQNCRRRKVEAS